MSNRVQRGLIGSAIALLLVAGSAWAKPLNIVAAENFYADVAAQIGGQYVHASSILSNPDQDPHLFEVSPKVARSLSQAQLVIYSGIGYDDWMAKLVASHSGKALHTIIVAPLIGRENGDNPHIWYNPQTMLSLATQVTAELSQIAPQHQSYFASQLKQFRHSMHALLVRIDSLRGQYAGKPATATEPVFGYMFAALGMKVKNYGFQLAVMNDTDPSARQQAAFIHSLADHQVDVLVYNDQVTDPATEQLKKQAEKAGVPIVGVSETMPTGIHYQQWMENVLNHLQKALK